MGSSVAGHAAARFGAALGAHAVALLASPTTFEGAPSGAERASPYNRLNLARRLAHNVLGDPSEADLLPVLSAAGVTRFFYYYGAGTERGERNAERLRDIAAVTLRPIQNTDHAGLPLRILARPDWPRLLHEDLGLPAVG